MVRGLAAATVCFLGLAWSAPLQTPEQFAGFRIGSDKNLVRWDRIVEYMRQAAASSPRVKFEELGKTTNGNPFIAVTVSSPDTCRGCSTIATCSAVGVRARPGPRRRRQLIENQRPWS